MDYNKLMYAVENGKSLIWNDPDPIDGNDYTVQGVSDMNAESDWVTIQYGEENAPHLSEAQVLISELSFKSGDDSSNIYKVFNGVYVHHGDVIAFNTSMNANRKLFVGVVEYKHHLGFVVKIDEDLYELRKVVDIELVQSKLSHWITTDEDSQQAYQKVGYKKYEYKQMVFHPNYPTGKMVQHTIDLSEYSKDECLYEMAPYGYSEDDYDSWLGTENEHLIAECIFEGSLQEI